MFERIRCFTVKPIDRNGDANQKQTEYSPRPIPAALFVSSSVQPIHHG
jgi:hypothetical protein